MPGQRSRKRGFHVNALPIRSRCRAAGRRLRAGAETDRPPPGPAAKEEAARLIDLSLLVAPEYPCTWATLPPFQINHAQRIGPRSATDSDILILDGNTGTQLDGPPHSVTRPGSTATRNGGVR